jgi:hypothetical protein
MWSQGETLPSWSMRVTMISSPGLSVRPMTRDIWKVRLVMLGPMTISRAEPAPRKSAIAACALSQMSTAFREAGKVPPRLLAAVIMAAATASITRWGTCVPAGLSNQTVPLSAKAGNWPRTRSVGNGVTTNPRAFDTSVRALP